MPIYVVSYYLNNKKLHPKIQAELEKLQGRKVARSCYFLGLENFSAQALKMHLIQFIDHDDTLIVIKARIEDIATEGVTEDTINWIESSTGS